MPGSAFAIIQQIRASSTYAVKISNDFYNYSLGEAWALRCEQVAVRSGYKYHRSFFQRDLSRA